MVVYIQKRINGKWCTLLTVPSEHSCSAFTHLCTRYCQHKFRISLDKTDDTLPEPQGLSLNEAIDALSDIKFGELTWNQGEETFYRVVDIVREVDKWYKH